MLQTYQTKIKTGNTYYLDEAASFFGLLKRKLFVDLFIRNKNGNECKREYMSQFQITSRQYNAIRILLEGQVKSVLEKNQYDIKQLEAKIKSLQYDLNKKINLKEELHHKIPEYKNPQDQKSKKFFNKYQQLKFKIHHKKRKLYRLKNRLDKLKQDQELNKIRICSGSRKLFSKQHHLKENHYKDFNEWKTDWVQSRNSSFYCIGSKDERSGNQTCTYTTDHKLRLRVANRFINQYGHYIAFDDVIFPYGGENIEKALQVYLGTTRGNRNVRYCKSAISYQFIRKQKGWYLYATVDIEVPKIHTSKSLGCIGIDLNAGFVSLCEVDRFGNPLEERKLKLNCYHRRSEQVKASIGDVVKEIVNYSVLTGKPISVEKLNFDKKKATLGEESPIYARMLSGLAYNKFNVMLKSRAQKNGVEIIEVNPEYTSIMGQVKYMKRYGLSSHGSAACVIARRGLGCKIEKINKVYLLGDYNLRNLSRIKKWMLISKIIKNKYNYQERIQLLLTK